MQEGIIKKISPRDFDVLNNLSSIDILEGFVFTIEIEVKVNFIYSSLNAWKCKLPRQPRQTYGW